MKQTQTYQLTSESSESSSSSVIIFFFFCNGSDIGVFDAKLGLPLFLGVCNVKRKDLISGL